MREGQESGRKERGTERLKQLCTDRQNKREKEIFQRETTTKRDIREITHREREPEADKARDQKKKHKTDARSRARVSAHRISLPQPKQHSQSCR